MEKLKTLDQLLEITSEAEGLASDGVDTDTLRSLFGKIRRIAKDALSPTRYQLCMIGIVEECNLSRSSSMSLVGLQARLSRMHEDIARTIKEIKASRQIM
jgi:hypothetical protein